MAGLFIVVDGPDGAGKTTVLRLLYESLSQKAPVCLTAEPTRSPLGLEIRRILRSGTAKERQALTDLFIEDRAAHIREEILPCLRTGGIVLCDRYKYSTVVYQQLQGEPRALLVERSRDFLAPDIAFILTLPDAGALLQRIRGRGGARECFETREALEKIIRYYDEMKDCFPSENIVFCRAGRPARNIAVEMLKKIDKTR